MSVALTVKAACQCENGKKKKNRERSGGEETEF